MKVRHDIALILALAAACGDNEGPQTATNTGTPTTMPVTDGPATLTMSEGTSTNASTDTDPTNDATSVPTAGTTSTGENAPVFLTFSANVTQITEGESVTFTAILTDPDGVDDIVGGSLQDANGAADFGPFMAAGQAGTYSITVSWAQIHQAVPIHFENMAESRTFNARFFDQAANSATKTIALSLQCAGGSACDGACTDLASDGANCGTCGHTCTSMGCEGGTCSPTWSECFTAQDGFDNCNEMCQSIGETCAEAQCAGMTAKYFVEATKCMADLNGLVSLEACDTMQVWANPAIKCCCTDSN
ncbi:hypothetical protein [Nannocystis pusilla]|uniref:hypothetical protein n=1 Tax=Nannocystis pusilla TaxID=889268 RepID=UPI003DA1E431